MLSESQTVEELSEIPNEIMCEKPPEPLRNVDKSPTIIRTMMEGEELFNIHLENFPMSVNEVVLFTFYQNKCIKILGI